MNKTEALYSKHLIVRQMAGEIRRFDFESIKLRLAANTFYTPDFLVVPHDAPIGGPMEFHEIKGFWRDDARVKWKVAAELFPEFTFVAVTRKKKQWVYEVYGDREMYPGARKSNQGD